MVRAGALFTLACPKMMKNTPAFAVSYGAISPCQVHLYAWCFGIAVSDSPRKQLEQALPSGYTLLSIMFRRQFCPILRWDSAWNMTSAWVDSWALSRLNISLLGAAKSEPWTNFSPEHTDLGVWTVLHKTRLSQNRPNDNAAASLNGAPLWCGRCALSRACNHHRHFSKGVFSCYFI